MYYRTFQRKVWLRVCIYVLLAIMIGTYWMTGKAIPTQNTHIEELQLMSIRKSSPLLLLLHAAPQHRPEMGPQYPRQLQSPCHPRASPGRHEYCCRHCHLCSPAAHRVQAANATREENWCCGHLRNWSIVSYATTILASLSQADHISALAASALTTYYRVQIIRGYDVSWAGAQTYICM